MKDLFKNIDGLSEKEQKSLEVLAEHLTKVVNEKGLNSEELLQKMDDKIKEFAKEKDLDEVRVKELQKALKEQGTKLTALKENGIGSRQLSGLKKAFNDNYDTLVKAIKENRTGFEIKAIAEHDDDLVVTRESISSGIGNIFLEENITENDQLFMKRRNRQFIRDIVNVTQVEDVPEVYTFWEEGDEEGAIAIVEENTVKPQVGLGLVKNKVEAQKAAGYIVVTEEVIKWRKRAWANIQRLFRDKVSRDYNNILHTQLIGNATGYLGTTLDGTIPNPTDLTAVIAATLQLETLNFLPDTFIVNPADKWRLALTETTNGQLILPYIQSNGGQFSLLGLNVITSNEVTSGEFYLGESDTWYIEEEPASLRTGLVNDDLIKNRMTIVGEVFFLSYIPSVHAGSWVHGNFNDIKEALQSA